MRTGVDSAATRLVLAIRYRDVAAAIDWLCTALDFHEHEVVTAENGTILRAQLTFGNDMIMLLPARGADDALAGQPSEVRGAERQSCYFVVDDADSHCRTAKAAGADIILDIGELDHGGRGYSCRDPEGHVWSFGTYDPWQVRPLAARGRAPTATARAFSAPVLLGAMLAAAVVAAALMWMAVSLLEAGRGKRLAIATVERAEETRAGKGAKEAPETGKESAAKDAAERAARDALQQLARERTARESAERAAQDALRQLASAQSAKEVAERATQDALKHLTRERGAKEAAERAVHDPVRALAREREAKEAAERAAQAALEEAARERGAKEAAERVAQTTQQELTRERSARDAAERAARDAMEELARQRGAKAAAERAAKVALERPAEPAKKGVAAEPAKRSAAAAPGKARRQAKEPDPTNQVWECLPKPPSGEIVCEPLSASAVSAKAKTAPSTVQKRVEGARTGEEARRLVAAPGAKRGAAEPAKGPAARPPGESSTTEEVWECLPRPPTGQIICQSPNHGGSK